MRKQGSVIFLYTGEFVLAPRCPRGARLYVTTAVLVTLYVARAITMGMVEAASSDVTGRAGVTVSTVVAAVVGEIAYKEEKAY